MSTLALAACGGGGSGGGGEDPEARPAAPEGVQLGGTVALADANSARPYFYPRLGGIYRVALWLRWFTPGEARTSATTTIEVTVGDAAAPTVAEVRARLAQRAFGAGGGWLPPDAGSPTLRAGSADAASAIAGSRLLDGSRPEFLSTGDVQRAGLVFPDSQLGRNVAVSVAATDVRGNHLGIEFDIDAPAFEVLLKGLGPASALRVVVDGRLANAAPLVLPSDGSLYLVLGVRDTWVSGVGTTGYLAAPPPRRTPRQRRRADVLAPTPQVLVVAAGRNDTAFADAAVRAAASGRPNFVWVPNYDEAWIIGTGNAARPAGKGNADRLIAGDDTHPTPEGIEHIATRLAAHIAQSVR